MCENRDGNYRGLTSILRRLVLLLFLATGSPSFAKTTTMTYSGSYKGQECSVQVNWHNWTGLGPVDGHINLPDGTTIPFSGNNSRKGVLEIEAAGESVTLVKERDGNTVSWIGKELSFSDAPGSKPSITPKTSATGANDERSNPKVASHKAVWVIACQASSSRQEAEKYVDVWAKRGFTSGSLWIPDYSSLSGAKMYLTYVGWYDYASQKDEAMAELQRVKRHYPKAYGIKLDQSGRREQF